MPHRQGLFKPSKPSIRGRKIALHVENGVFRCTKAPPYISFRANAVLLGSAHTEKFDLDDVAYVYVVPRRQRVKLNVKICMEINFRTPHAIDAMSSPQLHHTGQEAPVLW